MCGYYRLPGEPTKEEVDEKQTKKEDKVMNWNIYC